MSKSENVTGVLMVHGIGTQQPGETLDKVLSGLRRVQAENIPADYEQGEQVSVGDQSVRFYEVYWADLLRGEKTMGSFQLQEMLSLAWFPLFNFWRSNYPKGSYSFLKIIWWSLLLPVMNLFILLAYYGGSVLGQVFSKDRHKKSDDHSKHERTLKDNITRAAGRAHDYSNFDAIMDDFVGDVFNYVNSANNAFYRAKKETQVADNIRHVYSEIVQRFYQQLLRTQQDGCDNIQIVAHSLGTVVSFHALSGILLDWEDEQRQREIKAARSRVSHLYTIGSPLEKIRFFWPLAIIRENPLGDMKIKWDNFVSFFDPVAGVLKRYDQWGEVDNHRMLGGGFIRGHVVYEHSREFIRELTEGLSGQQMIVERTVKEKWRDRLILLGETLLAPVAVLMALLMGLSILIMAVSILPYMVSWLLGLFLSDNVVSAVTTALTWFLIIIYVYIFTVEPFRRASKVHDLYWRPKHTGR